jgi:hypothetical protein
MADFFLAAGVDEAARVREFRPRGKGLAAAECDRAAARREAASGQAPSRPMARNGANVPP